MTDSHLWSVPKILLHDSTEGKWVGGSGTPTGDKGNIKSHVQTHTHTDTHTYRHTQTQRNTDTHRDKWTLRETMHRHTDTWNTQR